MGKKSNGNHPLLVGGLLGLGAYVLLSKPTATIGTLGATGVLAKLGQLPAPMLTAADLVYICGAVPRFAMKYIEPLNRLMPSVGITTRMRVVHFLAQVAQESIQFEYSAEIASGRAYEGRKDLGNTQKGDGVKYKGRGLIQVTGRNNYAQISKDLGIDYLSNPTWLERPEDAVRSALWYWQQHKLNEVADTDDVVRVTKKINGGTAGLSNRKDYLAKAKKLLFRLIPGRDIAA